MNCPRCGKSLIDGARFCPFCGASVTSTPKSEDPLSQDAQKARDAVATRLRSHGYQVTPVDDAADPSLQVTIEDDTYPNMVASLTFADDNTVSLDASFEPPVLIPSTGRAQALARLDETNRNTDHDWARLFLGPLQELRVGAATRLPGPLASSVAQIMFDDARLLWNESKEDLCQLAASIDPAEDAYEFQDFLALLDEEGVPYQRTDHDGIPGVMATIGMRTLPQVSVRTAIDFWQAEDNRRAAIFAAFANYAPQQHAQAVLRANAFNASNDSMTCMAINGTMGVARSVPLVRGMTARALFNAMFVLLEYLDAQLPDLLDDFEPIVTDVKRG